MSRSLRLLLAPLAILAALLAPALHAQSLDLDVAASAVVPDVAFSSVAWGDYTGNGALDLVVTGRGASGNLVGVVYRNDGAGRLTLDAAASALVPDVAFGSVAWGDYTGDGWLDLVVTGLGESSRVGAVYRNDGAGGFTLDAAASALVPDVAYGSVAWGDYTGDGALDLVVTGEAGAGVYVGAVYRNDGSGALALDAAASALVPDVAYGSVAWGDYTGDGALDLVVAGLASGGNVGAVYRNDGAGGLSLDAATSDLIPGVFGASVAWGDYTGDGWLDLVFTGQGTGLDAFGLVYRNDGAGALTVDAAASDVVDDVAYGSVAWGDYTGDGWLDLVVTGETSAGQVYRNDGAGGLARDAAASTLVSGVFNSSVAWADYTGDGWLDLTVTGRLSPTANAGVVYRNISQLYVDASVASSGDGLSWNAAFQTLTEALAVARRGSVVRVAEGVYTPSATGDRDASFVVRGGGLQILGGYAAGGAGRDRRPNDGVMDTILSGDLLGDDGPDFANNDDNSIQVMRMTSSPFRVRSDPDAASYTLLEGLTIRGGNGGGGLSCYGGSSGDPCAPAVTDVAFVGNAATGSGGAVLLSISGDAVFTNVTFSGNTAGVGGGAVYAQVDSSPVFTNVTFSGNTAGARGGALWSQFSGGVSETGDVDIEFTNVTFSGNTAGSADGGGAVHHTLSADSETDFAFRNVILWGNANASGPSQVSVEDAGVTFDHALLQGGCAAVTGPVTTCTDVLDQDPLFADAAGGDLTLRIGSPALSFGDATLLPADTYDLDADGDTAEPLSLDLARAPRVQGLGLDLGAFDRVGAAALTGADGWRMLSAPSTTETVGGLLSTVWTQGFPGADVETGAPNVFRYDESATGDLQQGYAAPASATDPLPAGTGVFVYVYADDDPGTPGVQGGFPKPLTTDGAEATAPFDFALSYTDSGSVPDDGWNLLGNPFAAGLALDALARTDVSGASYVWDPALGRYLTRTSGAGDLGPVLGSFQGFWAQTLAPAATLNAPPAARVEDEVVMGRGDAPVALRFQVSPEGDAAPAAGDAAWLVFADGGTVGLDALDAYELGAFGPRPATLYAVADGLALDVSVLPADGAVVSLALDVAEFGDYVMTWSGSGLPGGGPLTLTDAVTGGVIDLRTATSYAFWADGVPTVRTAPATDDRALLSAPRPQRLADGAATSARFTVHVGGNATAGAGAPTATTLGMPRPNPSAGGARLTLSLAVPGPVRAEVYDALGRRVAVLSDGPLGAGRHDLRVAVGALAPGLYIVRVVTADGVLDQRLTVIR